MLQHLGESVSHSGKQLQTSWVCLQIPTPASASYGARGGTPQTPPSKVHRHQQTFHLRVPMRRYLTQQLLAMPERRQQRQGHEQLLVPTGHKATRRAIATTALTLALSRDRGLTKKNGVCSQETRSTHRYFCSDRRQATMSHHHHTVVLHSQYC